MHRHASTAVFHFIPTALLLAGLLLFPGLAAVAGPEDVAIGVLAKRGAEFTLARWQPTADYLTERVPGFRFRIVPIDFHDIYAAAGDGEVDFILANSGIYVELEARYGAGRIVTLRNLGPGGYAYTRFGGVLFTRRDRQDITGIADLAGLRLAAVEENSFGGYLVGRRELRDAGVGIERDLRELRFVGTHDAVVYAVRDGLVDAGTVRTDTLERMGAEGKIRPDDFKVLAERQYDDFHYRVSTRLYPEWPLARLRHTAEALSDRVAAALLAMPADSPAAQTGQYAGWTVPLNYQPVHELMKELKVGPYRSLGRVTLGEALRQHWAWVAAAAAFLLLLALATAHVAALNRRLRRAEGELTHARDSLAERVRERTAELEESHRRLALVYRDWNDAFDAIQDPIFIHDRDLRIVHANPAYVSRTGLPAGQVRGRRYWELFPLLDGPLPECSEFPEHMHVEGDEIELDSGEVFVSRSFGIKDAQGGYRHAIHILEDVTDVRRAERQLRHRVAFESVIGSVAAAFVTVDGDLESAIDGALREIGEFVAAERAYLFRLDAERSVITNTHEWLREDTPGRGDESQGLCLDQFPWLRQRLLAREEVVVSDIALLPDEAAAEREYLAGTGVHASVAVPVAHSGGLAGFIGADRTGDGAPPWSPEEVRFLRTAGEIIANALRRREAEEAVRHSERSLAEAQAIAHLGNWEWDILTNALAWSDEIYRIFGVEPHQFGATYDAFLGYVHPDDRQAVVDAVNRALDERAPYGIDHRIVMEDGRERVVHEIGQVTFDDGGRPIRMVGTVQDVTELRRAEMETKRLNRALRTISVGNTTLVHARDEGQLLRDLCRVIVETGGYRLAWVGYPGNDEAHSVRPMAHAGFDSGYLESVHISWGQDKYGSGPTGTAIREGRVVTVHDVDAAPEFAPWREEALRRGYASVISLPLIAEEEIIGALTIDAADPDAFDEPEVALLSELAADLAYGIRALRARQERDRTQEALLETERRYHDLYDTAPNGYVSVRAEDGVLIQCNPAFARLLGYQREQLCGRKVFELYADTPDGLAKAKRVFESFRHGDSVRDAELQMRRADGQPLWVSLSVEPVLDEQGRVVESRSSIIDISGRKLAEDERRVFAERLEKSLLQTIQAIALTIEKRDPYTAGHQQRVAELAVAIGQRMDLPAEQIEGIRLGALIHDIGKVYVPTEILNRPGRLDEAQFLLIKTHPQVGYDIVKGIEFPWPLADIVVQHHERLDGSGYPAGLKGDAILLESRILAVADVVEAMATHRPYRPALPLGAALDEIESHKGVWFDPEVADVCLRLFRDEGFQWDGWGKGPGGLPQKDKTASVDNG